MQSLALHHNSRWMVKPATKLWIAEKFCFSPQAISLNLLLYSKQSAYHELTNCKLFFPEVTAVLQKELRFCCLQNKNSTRNSSEIVLPVLSITSLISHIIGMGYWGPFKPWMFCYGCYILFFTLAVMRMFEHFLHKTISNNLVTLQT